MSITSNRHRDYNGRGHRGPVARVLSGVMPIKTGVSTENAEYISSCADHTIKEQLAMSARVKMNTPAAAPAMTSSYTTKEQLAMSARVNVNTPAAAPAMTSTHATEKQPAMSVRVNVNTPIAAPVTASAYIEKYCASDIYICKGQEQAGQYSYNYKTEDLVNASATASALAKHGRAASYDQTTSWGIVAL